MFPSVTHVPPAVVTSAGLNTGFAGWPAGIVWHDQSSKSNIPLLTIQFPYGQVPERSWGLSQKPMPEASGRSWPRLLVP